MIDAVFKAVMTKRIYNRYSHLFWDLPEKHVQIKKEDNLFKIVIGPIGRGPGLKDNQILDDAEILRIKDSRDLVKMQDFITSCLHEERYLFNLESLDIDYKNSGHISVILSFRDSNVQ